MGKLKIYTDENVDVRIAEGLRRRGIEAFSAHEKGTVGIKDKQHFAKAKELNAVIFTHDPHFVSIAKEMAEAGKEHTGVIFTEMHRFALGECIRRLTLYAEVVSPGEMINQIEFL